jgi:exoribonuclease R
MTTTIDGIDTEYETFSQSIKNSFMKPRPVIHVHPTYDNREFFTPDCITIDPPNSTDYDDAISIYKMYNSHDIKYYFAIHIANPTSVMRNVEKSIYELSIISVATKYIFGTTPMHLMPDNILHASSFKEGGEYNAITITVEFNPITYEPNPLSVRQFLSRIRINKNITYDEAAVFISNPATINLDDLTPVTIIKAAAKISEQLKKLRDPFNSIKEFDNAIIASNPTRFMNDGKYVKKAKKMIEEFMIYYNILTAIKINDYIKQNIHYNPAISGIFYNKSYYMTPKEHYRIHSEDSSHTTKIYTRITSPLRRLSDCIGQIQITHILNNSSYFTYDAIQYYVDFINENEPKINNVQSYDIKVRSFQAMYHLLSQCGSIELHIGEPKGYDNGLFTINIFAITTPTLTFKTKITYNTYFGGMNMSGKKLNTTSLTGSSLDIRNRIIIINTVVPPITINFNADVSLPELTTYIRTNIVY